MKSQLRKMSHLWKIFESAFLQSREGVGAFEVRSVLSLVSLYLNKDSMLKDEQDVISSEILSLHPQARELCISHFDSPSEHERSFRGIVDTLSSVSDLSIVLGGLHQWCLQSSQAQSDSKNRKKIGAYYTPKHVVQGMLRDARPILKEFTRDRSGSGLIFCDPACGAGQFIVTWLEELLDEVNETPEALASQFYGVDRDPVAIWLCRISVLLAVRRAGGRASLEVLMHHFRVGDSLLGAIWTAPREPFSKRLIKELKCAVSKSKRGGLGGSSSLDTLASDQEQSDAWFVTALTLDDAQSQDHWLTRSSLERWSASGVSTQTLDFWAEVRARHQVFHWFDAFPEIAARGGFDLIIGNPPYVNSIELAFKNEKYSAIFHEEEAAIRGSADLSYHFLRRGMSLVREGGGVYFLLPRAVFSAPSLSNFWDTSGEDIWLRHATLYDNHRLFEGASIFVSGALWHRCGATAPESLSVAQYNGKDELTSCRDVSYYSRHWWTAISGALEGRVLDVESASSRLKDVFDVSASMTTGEFYNCRPYLGEDSESLDGVPLLTSGAIDPGEVKWSLKASRILGKDYLAPRLRPEVFFDERPLERRRERAHRPKVLVAGLAARIEAVLLREPSQGAVSTLTILHPSDDLIALEDLVALLNSDWATKLLRQQLGANALGGGNITVSKDFVMNLPLACPPWLEV